MIPSASSYVGGGSAREGAREVCFASSRVLGLCKAEVGWGEAAAGVCSSPPPPFPAPPPPSRLLPASAGEALEVEEV